jgi:hypothetical protein
VLPQFAYTIIEFRATHNAAAAQVDAVGHSMGGLVVRQAEQLAGFLGTDSFGYGYVHELITIGTPHLGSPLAIDMLNGQQPNQCVDGKLAKKGSFAFQTVTLNLDPGTVTWSGAMGDLEGNGILSGYLSHALTGLQSAGTNPNPVHTAMIAGQATTGNAGNFAHLGVTTFSSSWFLPKALPRWRRSRRPHNRGVADAFPGGEWRARPQRRDREYHKPAQRPDQRARGEQRDPHDGAYPAEFVGPAELDSNSATGIPSLVMQLLNTPPTQDYGFYLLY